MKHLAFKPKSVFNSRHIIALGIFAIIAFCANAQTTDSVHKTAKEFKNSIKLNVSNRILYDNALQFSYERIINKHQSLNISVGYQEFPGDGILNLDSTRFGDSKKKSGYSFGVDYRFYLSKENKYDAPRGVYLAPFITFYQFDADRALIHTDSTGAQSSANINTRINFFNIGGELGYQFVLGKRWVIDAVLFGPALTNYNFKAKLDNHLPGLDDNEALQAVIDALKEKLPLLNDLTSDKGISKSGTEAFWAMGFRYNISIGFRF
jgi:hypothetical protein